MTLHCVHLSSLKVARAILNKVIRYAKTFLGVVWSIPDRLKVEVEVSIQNPKMKRDNIIDPLSLENTQKMSYYDLFEAPEVILCLKLSRMTTGKNVIKNM